VRVCEDREKRAEEVNSGMSYYMLTRTPTGELYSMVLVLSEGEARRYGYEGKMVPVRALCVWTSVEALEGFRESLSVEHGGPHSPLSELIRDMKADKVDVIELDSVGISGKLRRALPETQFVLIDPGPRQEIQKIEKFLGWVRVHPSDGQGVLESDEKPEIIGPPMPEHKAAALGQAVGKTIANVEYGVVEGLPEWVHKGEAIVLHFTDGTALSIEIGSNAKNISEVHPGLMPGDFYSSLLLTWRDRDPPK
jgi:hypothetical protein